mgnify:CR=1 FL=1
MPRNATSYTENRRVTCRRYSSIKIMRVFSSSTTEFRTDLPHNGEGLHRFSNQKRVGYLSVASTNSQKQTQAHCRANSPHPCARLEPMSQLLGTELDACPTFQSRLNHNLITAYYPQNAPFPLQLSVGCAELGFYAELVSIA